jgi:hypothetical protein
MGVAGHFRAYGASNLKSMSPKMHPVPPCSAGVGQRRDSNANTDEEFHSLLAPPDSLLLIDFHPVLQAFFSAVAGYPVF